MKTKTLLSQLRDSLDSAEAAKSKKQYDAVKKILKKLHARKKDLERQLKEDLSDKEKTRLEDKLKIVQAHRRKGVKALRKLKGKD